MVKFLLNVLKIGPITKSKKLSIHGLWAEHIVKPGPKRSSIDGPANSIRFLKHDSYQYGEEPVRLIKNIKELI